MICGSQTPNEEMYFNISIYDLNLIAQNITTANTRRSQYALLYYLFFNNDVRRVWLFVMIYVSFTNYKQKFVIIFSD